MTRSHHSPIISHESQCSRRLNETGGPRPRSLGHAMPCRPCCAVPCPHKDSRVPSKSYGFENTQHLRLLCVLYLNRRDIKGSEWGTGGGCPEEPSRVLLERLNSSPSFALSRLASPCCCLCFTIPDSLQDPPLLNLRITRCVFSICVKINNQPPPLI